MKKDAIKQMPEYFDRYINMTDDVSFMEALAISLNELQNFPVEKWKALGESVYAPGKWTIKDILQHLIDTERIFCYRVTAFARGETKRMISYDEELYARNADGNHRTVEDLISELILLRQTTIAMYRSFTPEMLHQSGKSFKRKLLRIVDGIHARRSPALAW